MKQSPSYAPFRSENTAVGINKVYLRVIFRGDREITSIGNSYCGAGGKPACGRSPRFVPRPAPAPPGDERARPPWPPALSARPEASEQPRAGRGSRRRRGGGRAAGVRGLAGSPRASPMAARSRRLGRPPRGAGGSASQEENAPREQSVSRSGLLLWPEGLRKR